MRLLACLLLCACAGAQTADDVQVKIQVVKGQNKIKFSAPAQVSFTWGLEKKTIQPGTYTVSMNAVRSGRVQYNVFVKTFLPSEESQAKAYMAQWKSRGYEPKAILFGRKFATTSGKSIDNRDIWVSLARFDKEADGNKLKARLQQENVWAWVWSERVEKGACELSITAADGRQMRVKPSVEISCPGGIELQQVNTGYWAKNQKTLRLTGTLDVHAGPDGLLEVCETARLEDYLAGVLPAEMPSSWPQEALRAQAVAARSEILANMSGKHMLDGFDFCATEHCRAYLGAGGRASATDQAAAATKGVAMTYQGRFLPAVFCANCGGMTEDNETVWSGPANPALRSVADFPAKKAPVGIAATQGNLSALLKSRSAYCGGNADSYRWSREFSREQLTALVNKTCPVGTVKDVVTGDRGPGGRLKWIKLVGSKETKTISKELNIRTAFGGLPSAMFIIDMRQGRFRLTGGGRGHGVGLCQDGARGMASAGHQYKQILAHYFPRAEFEYVHFLGGN